MTGDDCYLAYGAPVEPTAKWNRDIVSLFESQVQRSPQATALVCQDAALTYADLNQRANRLARHLVALGVTPRSYVGICLERSFEAIVGILAILKAGAAYVPIDHQYPSERIRVMLQDSAASWTLTSRMTAGDALKVMARPVFVDEVGATERDPSFNLGIDVPPASPAYVMYTSGTTGTPKAVAIPQHGIVRLVWQANYIHLDSTDVILHHATCAFDAATFEIWAALLNGGTLVIHRPSLDLDALGRVVRDHGVTTLLLTTSVFHLVAEHKSDCLATLRQVVTGGDVLHARAVRKVMGRYPHLRIVNGYGPTENTTFTCCYVITAETDIAETIPIGRPVSGTNVFILDGELRRVAIGEAGELYTNGLGLARGYLNRDDLTRQHFVECPFPEAGGALYRTGDRVREDADGLIHFLGRMDRQVKIRGFRVEPAEIEHAINERSDVADSVVLPEQTSSTEKRLVAYVRPVDATSAVSAGEIKRDLSSRLPQYMVPAEVHVVDDFPLTANGKIDKDLLRKARPHTAATSTRDDVGHGLARVVLEVWRQQLQAPTLQVDASVYDHGASSLTVMVVQSELNERLTCLVDPLELARAQTPLDWTGIYEKALYAGARRIDSRQETSQEAS
jgi:amino acid adenylation domain-containing protein